MKTTVLAIAFAFATAAFAQTPANPPASTAGQQAPAATKTKPAKKHHAKKASKKPEATKSSSTSSK